MTTTSVDPIVLTHLRGAMRITHKAAEIELPHPVLIRVDGHAVEITVPNEDALNAWSIWLRAEVDVFPVGGLVHYFAKATAYDVPVVINWVEVPA